MHDLLLKFSPMDIEHTTLAAHLGVSNTVLAAAKKTLVVGEHYTAGRPTLYTAAGVAALEAHFGISKKEAPGCCHGPCKCLFVISPRGRMVLASDAAGAIWQIEVRNPALYSRGMRIPSDRYTPSTTRPQFARQRGRSPRYRGRF